MSRKKFLIIDGNSLTHRAFHALPPLSTSQGIVTNAVYGFTKMLFKALELIEPDYIAVAFDKGKITFRHASYAEYKANRKSTPAELRSQFPILKDVLKCLRINFLELENYEADDIIGTLAGLAEKKDLEVIVLTGDRDVLQLVSPRVKVLLTQKGISEMEEFDEGKVWDRYGVSPPQIIDVKGLMGDPSDNIPGIPGIGEKTALKLIQEHGTLEDVIAGVEKLPSRWRNKIKEYKDQALVSKKLATIDRQVPLDVDLEIFLWQGPDYPALLAIFNKLEFKTLTRGIIEKINNDKQDVKVYPQTDTKQAELETYQVEYHIPATIEELNNLKREILLSGNIALQLYGSRDAGINEAVVTIAGKPVYLLPVRDQIEALNVICDICANPQVKKTCYSGKEAIWLLHRHNQALEGLHFDIALAAYLLNPGYVSNALPDLALQYLNIVLPTEGEHAQIAGTDAIMRLGEILHRKLVELDMDRLYYEVELPLVSILAEMEIEGVAVNPGILRDMSGEIEQQIEILMQEIYTLAGEEFNINSPKQLGYILFEKLGLPVIKRTKTGYSTDASVLEELARYHPVVEKILEYRQLAKLKSTYIDSLFGLINPTTGRIHTTFHQDVTATGRLSSSDPNLQNIPIRLEQGRKIRKVFVPRMEGNLILAADYSQIELRILAHMSGDPNLVEAFREGQDIHTRTAAEVFGVPMDKVTPELRNRAKAVNFGIVYGISDFGLSRDIKVSRAEAARYIKSYFERYSGVKKFIDDKIAEAREKGYATTLLNRRRYLPDLFSSNRVTRAFGERTAINTPIQGSAADIIKLAMVRINKELKRRNLDTKMILQVHDELIFDVPQEELAEVKILVKEYMENALHLEVPLVVDLKVGPNWYDVRKV
jgi:DNA polymerase-1